MARKDPLSHLARHDGPLPAALAREVRALGAAAVPGLCAMATNPAGWSGIGPAANEARHALGLLGGRPEPEARAAVLEVFRSAPAGGAALVWACAALWRWADVADDVYPYVVEGDRRSEATEVLVLSGATGTRVVEAVEAELARDPNQGALLAEHLGDPALLPTLRAALDPVIEAFEDVSLIMALVNALSACTVSEDELRMIANRIERDGQEALARRRAEVEEAKARAAALEGIAELREAELRELGRGRSRR